MADDEYRGREKEYAQTMAGQLGTFTTAIVEADGMAKDAAAERFFRVSERENIDLHTQVSLVGSDKPFTIGASIPPVMVTKTGPIEISEAKLSLGMNVSSMNESSSVTDKKLEGEGRASWGFGLFKVSFGMRSSIAVKSERRRRSDYSAHCDVDVTMTQSPPPEGQMVILDAFADCMKRTMDLNMSLVERQLRDASETADPPPALKMDNEPGGGISQGPAPGA